MTHTLTQKEKDTIYRYCNPEWHNERRINFYKVIDVNPYGARIEIWYWIQYYGCRPKYNKEIITVPRSIFN